MSGYTVVWLSRPERQLAEMWIAARDQQAITDVTNVLDAGLRNEPYEIGESREGDFRIAHQTPLGIEYVVDDAEKSVRVMRVWHY